VVKDYRAVRTNIEKAQRYLEVARHLEYTLETAEVQGLPDLAHAPLGGKLDRVIERLKDILVEEF